MNDLIDYQVWMYYVPNPKKGTELHDEIVEWLDSMTSSRWSSMGFINVGAMFYIVDEDTAMLFRLRWPVAMTKYWNQFPGEQD